MSLTPIRTAWTLLVAFAALAGPLRAGVLVVDAAGGGNFTQLPAAIAAALDGDVVLVRPGTYSAYVNGPSLAKSFTLVADPPTSQPVLTDLRFHDQPAGYTIVARGFKLVASDNFGYGMDLATCAGAVVIEDCDVAGGSIGLGGVAFSPPGWSGAYVSGCASVTFVRSSLAGGQGTHDNVGGSTSSWSPGDGGVAAEVIASAVAFHECTLLGGAGGGGSYLKGANGGAGLSLQVSSALFSGSIAQGGAGGTGCTGAEMPQDCNGGPGIRLDSSSNLQVLDGSWTGGVAGAGAQGQPGLVGVPFIGPPGQPIEFAGTARSLMVSSPVREQQPGVLELDGVAGDVIYLFTAFHAGSLPLPGKKGWLALAPPFFGPFALGVIVDPAGELSLPFTAPNLVPATLEGQTFLLQALFASPSGAVLGSVTTFTLVDSTL